MTENNFQKEKGFECRDCGCRHFRVQGTRVASRQIVRYRVCRNCGKRLTTIERAVVK